MAAITSRWREHARNVIRDTLAGLSANADDKIKRAALRDAYPFGPREHHPYKIWCDEVRRVLKPKCKAGTLHIAVELSLAGTQEAELWRVRCGWCDSAGCLMCDAARRELEAERDRIDWTMVKAFVGNIRAEPGEHVHLAAFADWLTDQGFAALGRHYATRARKP